MRVPYSYAVVSYCPDLMDRAAKSVPLGVVGIATVASDSLLCMVMRRSRRGWRELSGDSLAHQALEDLPQCVEKLAVEGLRKAGPSKVIEWLGRRLTQSIHVSDVRENAGALSVEDPSTLTPRLVVEFGRIYRRLWSPARPRRRSAGAQPLVGVRPLRKALA